MQQAPQKARKSVLWPAHERREAASLQAHKGAWSAGRGPVLRGDAFRLRMA